MATAIPFVCKFLLDAGFEVDLVNNLARIKRADPAEGLDSFDVVVFHGRHDQADEQAVGALQRFVEGGKGLVVIHVASASFAPGEPQAPSQAWRDLVGSVFDPRISGHPAPAPIQLRLDRPDHPIVAGIPREFVVQEDELYQRMQVGVGGPGERLATGTAPDGDGGTAAEPVAFVLHRGRGRVFNLYLGHTISTHRDWRFQQMITQGVAWVSGRSRPQAAASP
jgi:type 1 glutamine amidotransferase